MTKVITENKEQNIDVIIRDNEIEISGVEFKPYWKRVLFVLFWWKNLTFVFKNPKIFYHRKSKGESIALFG